MILANMVDDPRGTFGHDAGLLENSCFLKIAALYFCRAFQISYGTSGGTPMKSGISDSKTSLDERADRAIELARKMSPGSARNDAMKKAGVLRLIADLAREIETKGRPIRGKKPGRAKLKDLANSAERPDGSRSGSQPLVESGFTGTWLASS
jgi:hypothetical protein